MRSDEYIEERTDLFTKLSTKDYHEKTLQSFEERDYKSI